MVYTDDNREDAFDGVDRRSPRIPRSPGPRAGRVREPRGVEPFEGMGARCCDPSRSETGASRARARRGRWRLDAWRFLEDAARDRLRSRDCGDWRGRCVCRACISRAAGARPHRGGGRCFERGRRRGARGGACARAQWRARRGRTDSSGSGGFCGGSGRCTRPRWCRADRAGSRVARPASGGRGASVGASGRDATTGGLARSRRCAPERMRRGRSSRCRASAAPVRPNARDVPRTGRNARGLAGGRSLTLGRSRRATRWPTVRTRPARSAGSLSRRSRHQASSRSVHMRPRCPRAADRFTRRSPPDRLVARNTQVHHPHDRQWSPSVRLCRDHRPRGQTACGASRAACCGRGALTDVVPGNTLNATNTWDKGCRRTVFVARRRPIARLCS
jgi:hypothetical protein